MSDRADSTEAALELFLAQRRRGDSVDAEAFVAAHPELAPELASAIDALLALERATHEPPGDDAALLARVGSFRIVREIGRGGMGVVLEAIEEPLGRRVALKVLPPELLSSASARARFRREAELAARLDHPGIATIFGAGVEDDRPWIAMRYVAGETLAHAIVRARNHGASCVHLASAHTRGRDAALAVAACLAKVARALQSAHDQGVVHRDVKPSNIIVASDGTPVLLDFGLAIEEESDGRSLTRTGETAGTPAYLTPESLSGELGRPDVQSDVYALGVTLYESLTLQRPYDAPTRAALYRSILAGAPTALRTLNHDVPRDLAIVVATAMERDRARRYRDAAALAQDLEACVESRPIAARPVPLHGRVLRWIRREPRLAAATAAVVVSLIGGLTWVLIVQASARNAVAEKNKDLSRSNQSLATAKAQAETNEQLATQRADDVLSLSAFQDLQDLIARADELWPAEPMNIAKYEAWLRDAHALLEGRPVDHERGTKAKPGLREHAKKLAEIEGRALGHRTPATAEPARARENTAAAPSSGVAGLQLEAAQQPEWIFADSDDRWWHVQLAKLVAELRAFSDPNTGLCSTGLSKEHGWGIARRLEIAQNIVQRTVNGPEASKRWSTAIALIRDASQSPVYKGLVLAPQLGLLPIGRDPDSGLYEFSLLESGEPAERRANGKLILKEETGLVFVLIPSAKFMMGAQSTDSTGPNYDPQAAGIEEPVTEVTLDAYFISKFEMTQAQWLRFTGVNPSQYAPGETFGNKQCSLLCPVEQVSWNECAELMQRLGLVIPTEAQWELAARAGTHSVWWTGNEKESLAGAGNLADAFYRANGGPVSWGYDEWLDDGWSCHAPVGTYRANAFGLHDVIGNVWEWCRDGYGSYEEPMQPGDGERPAAGHRACRGGGFGVTALDARSAIRFHNVAEFRSYDLGVRPARVIADH